MKKLMMILLLLSLMTSCRSRKKAVEIEREKIHEVIKTDTNIVISEEKKLVQLEKVDQKTEQTETDNSGDIIIKGNTEKDKDFHYHNVVDGDTISDILIKGNADFVIKNRWRVSEKKEAIHNVKENLNLVAKIARKSVAQSTIKDVAKEVKKVEKKVESKGFVFPIYLIGGLAVLFGIVVGLILKKFRM